MQRWQITTGFAFSAVLAALVVPTIDGQGLAPAPEGASEPKAPTPPQPTVIAEATTSTGRLRLEAELDQGLLGGLARRSIRARARPASSARPSAWSEIARARQ